MTAAVLALAGCDRSPEDANRVRRDRDSGLGAASPTASAWNDQDPETTYTRKVAISQPNARLSEAALASVRAAVRARLYKVMDPNFCKEYRIRDEAFLPIEVTGDDQPEVVVFLSNAECRVYGGTDRWFREHTNSPGGRIEIWIGKSPHQKIRFQATVRGFTPFANGIILYQHGAYCDAAGPSECVVEYRWNRHRDRFDLQSRSVCDVEHPCTKTEATFPKIAYSGLHPEPY